MRRFVRRGLDPAAKAPFAPPPMPIPFAAMPAGRRPVAAKHCTTSSRKRAAPGPIQPNRPLLRYAEAGGLFVLHDLRLIRRQGGGGEAQAGRAVEADSLRPLAEIEQPDQTLAAAAAHQRQHGGINSVPDEAAVRAIV